MDVSGGSSPSGAAQEALSAATAQADASGKPVTVNAMTTATSTTVAEPHGRVILREHTLPVRVREGSRWVPVNTALRKDADGPLSPQAVPGGAVRFSGGGNGPLAVISAGGTSLALSWPGRLPAPVAHAPGYYPAPAPVDVGLVSSDPCSGPYGEVSQTGLADLTDRVLLAGGQPQEYGTQVAAREDGWAPRRLRDPDHVDQRRAAISPGPMADYISGGGTPG